MSQARERILARIRAARGDAGADVAADAGTIRREAEALIPDPAIVQPSFPQISTVERFVERATSERLTATVAEIGDMADVPAAVRAYLDERGLGPDVAMAQTPALTALDWAPLRPKAEIEAHEPVAVTLADLAVAETGSLVFHASPETPTLLDFLPLHHVVVVERERIVRTLGEIWPQVRASGALDARLVSLVTGTSGTADIEAINVRGAHGPRYMHIVLVGPDDDAG